METLKRIEEKIDQLKKAENTVNQLTSKNKELTSKLEEQRVQYQQQV